MALSEDATTKSEHMINVFNLNGLSGPETAKALFFLTGALLRVIEKKHDLDHAMWMNLVSESITSAKADD